MVGGTAFIRYAQSLKVGGTAFIRYAQSLKVGGTAFIRYAQSQNLMKAVPPTFRL
jgi:hypothetical protein